MPWGISDGDDVNEAYLNDLVEAALGDGNPATGLGFAVFYDGSDSNWKARNGTDGTIDYSGVSPATVIQSAIDNAGGKQVIVMDAVTLDATITIGSYDKLTFLKKVTIDCAGQGFIFGTATCTYYATLRLAELDGQDQSRHGIKLRHAARNKIYVDAVLNCNIGIYFYSDLGPTADNLVVVGTIASGVTGIQLEGQSAPNHAEGNKFIMDYNGPNTTYGVYVVAFSEWNTFIGTIDNPAGTDIRDDAGGNTYIGYSATRTMAAGGRGSIVMCRNSLMLPQSKTESIGAGLGVLAVTFPYANDAATDFLIFIEPAWDTTTWVTAKGATGFTANFGAVAPGGGSTFDWVRIDISP